jgi:osomolarity two-component system response regulator SSK1
MEWGCMQALIDFDGWRQWKDFGTTAATEDAAKKAGAGKTGKKPKGRQSSSSQA